MPMDTSKYPHDWKAISLRIRERDGWQCKWCGVKNHAVGIRFPDGRFLTDEAEISIAFELSELPAKQLDALKYIRIVLTVAHLGTPHADGTPGDKHDKMDVRDENLAALCQRCHLVFDKDEHAVNRRKTTIRKRAERTAASGQTTLEML